MEEGPKFLSYEEKTFFDRLVKKSITPVPMLIPWQHNMLVVDNFGPFFHEDLELGPFYENQFCLSSLHATYGQV